MDYRTYLTCSRRLVDIECSSNAPCPNMMFEDFSVLPPVGTSTVVKFLNAVSEFGLPGTFLLYTVLVEELGDRFLRQGCNTTGGACDNVVLIVDMLEHIVRD